MLCLGKQSLAGEPKQLGLPRTSHEIGKRVSPKDLCARETLRDTAQPWHENAELRPVRLVIISNIRKLMVTVLQISLLTLLGEPIVR